VGKKEKLKFGRSQATSGLTEVLTPRKSEPRPLSEVRGFSEMEQNLDGEACKAS